MISRITKRMQVGGEGGFTLIELLVVIIIIAILAAIAIPMYLSQRQKGWKANVQSDLRNAAVVEESYFTANSAYTADTAATVGVSGPLYNEGFHKSSNVTFDTIVLAAGNNSYVMTAHHNSYTGCTLTFDSSKGAPVMGEGC